MASRSETFEISRAHRRVRDLSVSPETARRLETIAVAHMASGNIAESQACLNMIAKFKEKSEVAELKEMVAGIIAKDVARERALAEEDDLEGS